MTTAIAATTGTLAPGLIVAAVALTLLMVATWGADRHDLDVLDGALTRPVVWWKVAVGTVGVLVATAGAVMLLSAVHVSAVGSLVADGPDVHAVPPTVSGLAAPAVPPVGVFFVSLPPPPALSGLAAGSETRQGAPQSRREPRGELEGTAETAAPAGTFGLALEVEPYAGAAALVDVAPALPPVADAIAACESGAIDADGRPVLGTYSLTAANPTSSASGKFQAVTATWEWVTGLPAPASAYPEHVQDQFFVDLWDDGRGASHWDASRWCWGGGA